MSLSRDQDFLESLKIPVRAQGKKYFIGENVLMKRRIAKCHIFLS